MVHKTYLHESLVSAVNMTQRFVVFGSVFLQIRVRCKSIQYVHNDQYKSAVLSALHDSSSTMPTFLVALVHEILLTILRILAFY